MSNDPLASEFSRETVDERLVVICTQTREGRAAGRDPQCSTTSIRWMSDLAADALSSASTSGQQQQQHRAPDGGIPIPLPPEGNRDALVRGGVSVGPQTQYWRPGGVYLWQTDSKIEMFRHIQEMGWDLRQQQKAVEDHERIQQYRANYDRQLALHRAQPSKVPHPGLPRQFHSFMATPLSNSTVLYEVTPSVIWAAGAARLRAAVLGPSQQVWGMVGSAPAAQMWGAWTGSVQNGQPGKLWDLLGRVTEDYVRRVEEQRKEEAAEVQSRRSGEKAP